MCVGATATVFAFTTVSIILAHAEFAGARVMAGALILLAIAVVAVDLTHHLRERVL